jgi:hypothetical protein
MLSFLKSGDIQGAIRKLTNLPGLSISDSDKLKYSLLNHSMAMRANRSENRPIFTNIRQWEVEIEKRDIESIVSGRLPSMAANAAAARDSPLLLTIESDLRIDNAVLAFIMTNELAFLNRTIQMISLIARRCQEEQEDANWGKGEEDEYLDDDEDHDDDDELSPTTPTTSTTTFEELDLEAGGGGWCGRTLLQRSQSHDYPYTPPTAAAVASNRILKKKKNTNDLVASTSFLLQSGRLLQQFNNLCQLTGTNVVLVNAMTFRDRARSSTDTAAETASVQSLVISDIFLHFTKFDAEHRDPVVAAFLELRDISVSAWRTMSRLAFANLFRLTAGTEYETLPVNPEDAIFSNH